MNYPRTLLRCVRGFWRFSAESWLKPPHPEGVLARAFCSASRTLVPSAQLRQTIADATSLSVVYPHFSHLWIRSLNSFFFCAKHLGQVWLGLTLREGTSIKKPPASSTLYLIAFRSIPNPTSSIERFCPVFWRFLLTFFALAVIFSTLRVSVATNLLSRTIWAATLCVQS